MCSSLAADFGGNTLALSCKDRDTGWLRAYPSSAKSGKNARESVQDFVGAQNVQLWYSDGAPELHSACRDEGIRHDIADP